jgi:hypothetical protein
MRLRLRNRTNYTASLMTFGPGRNTDSLNTGINSKKKMYIQLMLFENDDILWVKLYNDEWKVVTL